MTDSNWSEYGEELTKREEKKIYIRDCEVDDEQRASIHKNETTKEIAKIRAIIIIINNNSNNNQHIKPNRKWFTYIIHTLVSHWNKSGINAVDDVCAQCACDSFLDFYWMG